MDDVDALIWDRQPGCFNPHPNPFCTWCVLRGDHVCRTIAAVRDCEDGDVLRISISSCLPVLEGIAISPYPLSAMPMT